MPSVEEVMGVSKYLKWSVGKTREYNGLRLWLYLETQ